METGVRLRFDTREPFAEGVAFGDTGPYERIAGSVEFALDPDDESNSSVVDLANAPRGADGKVSFSTDLYVLKPADPALGNRRLLYDVNNRGNKRALIYFNDGSPSDRPSSAEHAGNGFLMRRGYTLVWSGWQGDLLPGEDRLTIDVPVARDSGGEITGPVRAEFIADEPGVYSYPLSGNDYTRSYETASLDASSAALTVREYEQDSRVAIPHDEWQFARAARDGTPEPSSADCFLAAGFKPGWIYELVYTAKDPAVLGLGLCGLRDLVSFLLHAETDAEGTPNPLRDGGPGIEKAYAWGRSQSGRFLREFVYLGFNADPRGRRVFDGISPHVSGGGRVMLNHRFAQPGRYSRQHADHLYPSDRFPFAYGVTTDPFTGETDGILKRPDTDPLVVHTQTSSEYWERRGSLVHTDASGGDLPDHEKARVYLFAGSQHQAEPGKGPLSGNHKHPSNPLNTTPLLRALLDALDAWATAGVAPPQSRVPRRSEEAAVPADVVKRAFPSIPGVDCPGEPSRLHLQDYGPRFDEGVTDLEPPRADQRKEYAVLVPQIDADGNEIPGIRTPHVEAPLATYTGWNFRPEGSAPKGLVGAKGSYLPFAHTRGERQATGDSRPSIEERYASKEQYVRAIAVAAQRLVDQRLMLEEDADRYVEAAIREEALASLPSGS